MRMEWPIRQAAALEIPIAGVAFVADCAGAVYWPAQRLLAIADLHLEKGSSFAERGVFLPPYDTAATLAKIGRLIERYAPRVVVALGDSFHDGDAPGRVAATDLAALAALSARARVDLDQREPRPPAGRRRRWQFCRKARL